MAGDSASSWLRCAAHRAAKSRLVLVPFTATAGVVATVLSFNLPILGHIPFTLAHLAVGAGLSLGTCYTLGRVLTRNATRPALHQRGAVVARDAQPKRSASSRIRTAAICVVSTTPAVAM
jgi:hypothetical protein